MQNYVSSVDGAPLTPLDWTGLDPQMAQMAGVQPLVNCTTRKVQVAGGAFSSGVGIVLGVALGLFVVGAIVYGPKVMLKKIHLR